MSTAAPHVVIFAHSGAWDRLYQVAALAVTAASQGQETWIVLQFFALRKWVEGRLEEREPLSESGADADALRREVARRDPPRIGEMLELAREFGRLKVVACSASITLMGLDPDRVRATCDEVLGLPTVMQRAYGGTVIYV